jgi:hypothetical protein
MKNEMTSYNSIRKLELSSPNSLEGESELTHHVHHDIKKDTECKKLK